MDGVAGVLLIVKNYAGDVMNFEMAAEVSGVPVETVLTNNDVAVEASTRSQGRRGVAATVILEKMVGAAAERGDDLQSPEALGERISTASGTIGVALSSCTVPAAGTLTFELAEDEMEMSIGIHGEPGRRRVAMMDADAVAVEIVGAMVENLQVSCGEEVLLLVNGMGGAPLLELYGFYDAAARACTGHGVSSSRALVGNDCTSLEMTGASITLTRLVDQPRHLTPSAGLKPRAPNQLKCFDKLIHQTRRLGGSIRFDRTARRGARTVAGRRGADGGAGLGRCARIMTREARGRCIDAHLRADRPDTAGGRPRVRLCGRRR